LKNILWCIYAFYTSELASKINAFSNKFAIFTLSNTPHLSSKNTERKPRPSPSKAHALAYRLKTQSTLQLAAAIRG
jgi:hypothetical protein